LGFMRASSICKKPRIKGIGFGIVRNSLKKFKGDSRNSLCRHTTQVKGEKKKKKNRGKGGEPILISGKGGKDHRQEMEKSRRGAGSETIEDEGKKEPYEKGGDRKRLQSMTRPKRFLNNGKKWWKVVISEARLKNKEKGLLIRVRGAGGRSWSLGGGKKKSNRAGMEEPHRTIDGRGRFH